MKKMIIVLTLVFILLLPVFSCAEIPSKSEVREGAVVTFGAYEQNGDAGDGQEPVEWIVLKADGESALLLSRYVLDARPLTAPKIYDKEKKAGNAVTWSNSELRAWLNGEFIATTFSEEEKQAIRVSPVDGEEDTVFLLSADEVKDHVSGGNAVAIPTAAALALGLNTRGSDTGATWWWLRSRGDSDSSFALVMNSGELYPYGDFCFYDGGIRPALRLDLNALN